MRAPVLQANSSHGRRWRLSRLLTAVLILHVLPAGAIQRGDTVAILPFEDHSDFPGTWDIRRGLAEKLAIFMADTLGLVVLSHDTIAAVVSASGEAHQSIDQARVVGQSLYADFVLTGDIVDFSIRRFSVGNPSLGGYASYTALVDLETRLVRVFPAAPQVEAFRGMAEEEADDLGLTLMGKPTETAALHKQLNDVVFGSDVFAATIIGKATQRSVQQIVNGLSARVLNENLVLKRGAKILSLEGEEGFVNLGIVDKVEAGHRFDIYSRIDSQRVGAIQVVVPLAAHLSQIRITDGAQQIQPGDLLRAPVGR